MVVVKPSKPKPPSAIYLPVDAWTLRCLYNRSDYALQIASGRFVELHRESSPPRNGSTTIQVYYGLAEGRLLMVTLQWFEGVNREILRSGAKDPKQFYADGYDYHQHGGSRWWERIRRDPERIFPIVSLRLAYGWWRRQVKCPWFGPLEAEWRAFEHQARASIRL